jgi:hypothetical protein
LAGAASDIPDRVAIPGRRLYGWGAFFRRGFALTTATLLGGSGSRAAQATPSVFPLAGEFKFERGTKYPSPSGNHYLIFQTDGNLCVYTKDARFVWGLNLVTKNFAQNAAAIMQADGNLATYDAKNGPIWTARTGGSPAGTKLTLDPSGTLQLVEPNGQALWSSQ